MVHIIDYGVGNIQAFLNVYKRLGIKCKRSSSKEDLESATHLILPGVGSFDHAMDKFNHSGLRDAVERLVFEKKIPLLGICVGMQMLSTNSDEGSIDGLNWIPGRVKELRLNEKCHDLAMPHMGWNDINLLKRTSLFNNFPKDPCFYFLHSFYYDCDDKEDVLANAEYGITFDCVISKGNIFGIQCHPEKSHIDGQTILKNFAEL